MKKVFYALCFFIFLGLGCISSNQSAQQNTRSNTPSEHYTSSFPYQDVSKQLQKIQGSILRFTATGFYDTYFFTNRNVTLNELRQIDYSKAAFRTTTLDQSKAGTAISLLQNNDRTVLITAQHILAFPDTVVVYKKGQNIPKQTFVESMGIKDRQRNYLYTGNQILSLDILAEDVYKDLALVEIETPQNTAEASPININLGRAKDLQLGSFLYILGFPLGSPMVTRGIASAPDFDNGGGFLTDALFNHGISGGLIIATRDNFNSFEWVGMAVTASAIKQQFLIPDPAKKNTYENFEAYTDTALVSEQRLINYGLTQATPIEQIITFLLFNEDTLNSLGFSVTNLTDQ